MAELLLDSNIRIWVFLPIIMITFLVGILRHYFSLIIASQKKVELLQVQDRYRNRIQLKFRIKRAHLICFFALQSSAGSFQTVARKWEIFAQTSFLDEKTFFQQ